MRDNENTVRSTECKSRIFNTSDKNDFKKLVKKGIKIEYENPVINGTEGQQRLLNALGNIPNSDFLVFHCNTHLHVSYFDYIDGSKFDIFGLDDKTIVIIPYEKSTESSFNNMLEGIQSELGEGLIDNFVFQDYTIDDIMA